ncbi:MAG: DUF975 family protein [Oscillospiraceae bacterium]|nr:DUF975 family protein [Oscillospiraceae bacterium]
MSISGERRKYFKSEAKSLLRYNYFKQIFMTGLITLLTFGINAIKINIIRLLELEYSFYSMPLNMLFDLLAIFVTLPLYIGIIYVNVKLFEGENISIEGMFHYFSSGANLLDCYRLITAMAARFIVFILPFMLFEILFPLIIESVELIFPAGASIEIDITMVCICVVYLTVLFICVILFMRYFAAVFIFVKNPCLTVKDIVKKSAKMMEKRKFESLKLILSFSIWIIISHYFAGFLYIFFTLPYIMLSYASFLSFVLTEKGGDEFLTPAGDYIDKVVKTNNKINKKKVKIRIDGNLDRLRKITKIRKKQKS